MARSTERIFRPGAVDTAKQTGEVGGMDWLERLGEQLAREHEAFAVVLYGSHARGNARAESDIDVMILVPAGREGQASRDARRVQAPDGRTLDLDGWLRPCDPADSVASFDGRANPGLMCLRGGRALFDSTACVPTILAALERTWDEGPAPVGADEREAIRVWGDRMLRRILEPRPGREVAAAWRRAELLTELLPDAYRLRGWWYPGPDPALAELGQRAPDLHQAFVAALRPDATAAELRSLVGLAIEA